VNRQIGSDIAKARIQTAKKKGQGRPEVKKAYETKKKGGEKRRPKGAEKKAGKSENRGRSPMNVVLQVTENKEGTNDNKKAREKKKKKIEEKKEPRMVDEEGKQTDDHEIGPGDTRKKS